MHAHFLRLAHDPTRARFAVLHEASGPARGLVVYVHPFAEEMNKSRRMAALQSRALAAAGYKVLQPDLLGCGDSAGDIGDADWTAWVDDVVNACHWLRACARGRGEAPPLTLWGLRAGALLAAEAARRLGDVHRLLLWQPALSGKTTLAQFLRLQKAADLVGSRAAQAGPDARKELAAGRMAEIAGYRISPGLAQGMESASLQRPPPVREVLWLEVSMQDEPQMAPASRPLVQAWQADALHVDARAVRGPAFWQTVEIEEAPALISHTLAAMTAPPVKELSA
jgi:exosortase A-associated hydrolase 2